MIRTRGVLAVFLCLLGACGDGENGSEIPETTNAAVQTPAPPAAWVASDSTIEGAWFSVASNPRIKGKVVVNYLTLTFRSDLTVTRQRMGGGEVTREHGTYQFDETTSTIAATVKTEFGPRTHYFQQQSDGLARYFRKKPSTSELSGSSFFDSFLVKQGSAEWRNREKVELDDSPVGFIDPQTLTVGREYRFKTRVPLMPELDPARPLAALADVRYLAPNTTVLILERTSKNGTPWYRVEGGWINSIALFGPQMIEVAR